MTDTDTYELPSTDNYEVVVTIDPNHEEAKCYAVKNVVTGVFEYYDNLLPRTVQAMNEMDSKYMEMLNGVEVEPTLTAVPSELPTH
jgi:hypothetical protein